MKYNRNFQSVCINKIIAGAFALLSVGFTYAATPKKIDDTSRNDSIFANIPAHKIEITHIDQTLDHINQLILSLQSTGSANTAITALLPPNNDNIYKEILNDETDDLMENHPADDIYLNIWTRERLNPYSMPIDSLPDSILIDCSNFVTPLSKGVITSHFGPRRYRYHFGTDLKLRVGDSIRSSLKGMVRIIDYERLGYGHYVVIRHDNGLETVYAHLSKVLVEHNQRVEAGEVIALGGNTGRSTGPHLHYEIRYLGNAINPAHLVDFANDTIKFQEYVITKTNSFYYHSYLKELQSAKYYTVRKGDTLGRIAQRNGTSVNAICRLNKISSKKVIRPGERLRVR